MNTPRRDFRSRVDNMLSRLDNLLRWTGLPARIADEMADAPSAGWKRRPLRWSPMWLIALSCALFVLSLTWPSALVVLLGNSLGTIIVAVQAGQLAVVPVYHVIGPLGKSSLEDDEREAALRKDSFLFCAGLLAGLNCLGQPVLMMLSQLQHWQTAQIVSVAGSALLLNLTLFGTLPTLYASWNLRQLPKE
jgi:hypothetical protein